jgi:hypothetical protein
MAQRASAGGTGAAVRLAAEFRAVTIVRGIICFFPLLSVRPAFASLLPSTPITTLAFSHVAPFAPQALALGRPPASRGQGPFGCSSLLDRVHLVSPALVLPPSVVARSTGQPRQVICYQLHQARGDLSG